MFLDFSDEQDDLRDNVRAVLERECPRTLVRALVEGEHDGATSENSPSRAAGDALWHRMVELGWPSLTISEDCGGMGYGYVELAVVLEELGRVMAPGPLFPTLSQFVPAVREAGSDEQRKRFLAPVTEGRLTGTLAVAEATGVWAPSGVGAVCRPDDGGWILSGTKHWVIEGDAVDEVVVAARLEGTAEDDGIGLFVVPSAIVDAEPIDALDASRRVATLALHDVRVDADRVLGLPGTSADALRRVLEEATTSLALETLGTCQTIFDLTLDYSKERVQFGRAIGSFQAVKHKLADLLVAVERARATAYFAAACIDGDDPRRTLAASVAKAATGDAQRLVVKDAIQLHGGIGYTWEHDLHLLVKRAKSGDALLGTASEHRARIARLIADRRIDQSGPRWTLDGR